MNAPDTPRRLSPPSKPPRARKGRHTKAFIAELRRQCKLIAAGDSKDSGWQQLIHLPK